MGDFNVVAEDGIEPHLERRDAGALDFIRLQLRNPILASAGGIAEFVEPGIEDVPDHTALLDRQGRLIHDGARNQFDQIGGCRDELIQCRQQAGGAEALECFRGCGCEPALIFIPWSGASCIAGCQILKNLFKRWDLFQGQTQGGQVPRVAAAGTQAAEGALQVADPGQLRAEGVESGGRTNVWTAS